MTVCRAEVRVFAATTRGDWRSGGRFGKWMLACFGTVFPMQMLVLDEVDGDDGYPGDAIMTIRFVD